MGNYFILHIYVDKNKDMLFVPYKECKAGYALAAGPYKQISNVEWWNVSEHIIDSINEIMKSPLAEDTGTNIMMRLCGNKGFKQFSKKHICTEDKTLIQDGFIKAYKDAERYLQKIGSKL